MQQTVEALNEIANRKVREGAVLLVLSARAISEHRLPAPEPMAVGAIQHRLVEKSLRCDANLIVETASARDPHHFAVLLCFGATAIYPHLAYESLARLVDNYTIEKPYRTVMLNYRYGINKGRTRSCPKWASQRSPRTVDPSCSKPWVCTKIYQRSASTG